MIRTTLESETDILKEIAHGTNVFKPMEVDALEEVLDDYHAGNHRSGHKAITYEQDGKVVGFAYYAPTVMTDNTWYLYWIFVDARIQAKGIGSQMLQYIEDDIRAAGGRLFVIETSSLPSYDATRKFYLKHGYEQAAILQDFYTDGDDMVVFRKRLLAKG